MGSFKFQPFSLPKQQKTKVKWSLSSVTLNAVLAVCTSALNWKLKHAIDHVIISGYRWFPVYTVISLIWNWFICRETFGRIKPLTFWRIVTLRVTMSPVNLGRLFHWCSSVSSLFSDRPLISFIKPLNGPLVTCLETAVKGGPDWAGKCWVALINLEINLYCITL